MPIITIIPKKIEVDFLCQYEEVGRMVAFVPSITREIEIGLCCYFSTDGTFFKKRYELGKCYDIEVDVSENGEATRTESRVKQLAGRRFVGVVKNIYTDEFNDTVFLVDALVEVELYDCDIRANELPLKVGDWLAWESNDFCLREIEVVSSRERISLAVG